MDHHRPVLGAVGPDVGQAEALRELVVELDGAELPAPAEGVVDVEVDLRPVERAVARVDPVGDPAVIQRRLERALGLVPSLVRADALLRPGGELDARRSSKPNVR